MAGATAAIAVIVDHPTAAHHPEDRTVDAAIRRRHRMVRVPLAAIMAAPDRTGVRVVPTVARMEEGEEGVLTGAIANVLISGLRNAARVWAAFLFATYSATRRGYDAGTLFADFSRGVLCILRTSA